MGGKTRLQKRGGNAFSSSSKSDGRRLWVRLYKNTRETPTDTHYAESQRTPPDTARSHRGVPSGPCEPIRKVAKMFKAAVLCTLLALASAEEAGNQDTLNADDNAYGNLGQATSFSQQAGVRSQPLNLDPAAATYSSNYGQSNVIERAQPFDFGYNIQDEYGNTQFRQEKGDESGTIQGSYGYTDAYGVYRKVNYIADAGGFRADIKSNEPGMKQDNPADAQFAVEAPPQGIQSITATRSGTFVSPGGQSPAGTSKSGLGSGAARPAGVRPRFPPASRPDSGFPQFPQ